MFFILYYINTYSKRNATLERNDGQLTTFVAPKDYISPFGPLTSEKTIYTVIL